MKKPLLIAVSTGVLAFLFMALYLTSIETKYKSGSQMVKVLVAKEYINQGSMIELSMVEERQIPKDYVQPKTIQSIKDLLNGEGSPVFMTIVPVEKGEQVLTTKLSMLGVDTGISAIIPSGKRAFTHAFSGISGIVKPGNKVDIVAVMDAVTKDSGRQQISRTILQNVLVLAVGKDVLGAVKKDKDKLNAFVPEDAGSQVSVSFALTPQEGEILSLAAENGKIFIALRSMGDNSTVESSEAKFGNISKDMSNAVKPADAGSADYLKAIQKQQGEAMALLKKYKKQ